MRRLVILVCLFLAAVVPSAAAQTPTGTPNSKLLVDVTNVPDLATAQSYTFAYYPDTATTSTPIVMTCAGAAVPFTCSGAFPPFPPGAHSLAVTARNVAGESPKSPVLSFTFVLIPNAPQNIRIGDDELADADYVAWGMTAADRVDRP